MKKVSQCIEQCSRAALLVSVIFASSLSQVWAEEAPPETDLPPALETDEFAAEELRGLVQQIDVASNTLEVSGWQFEVPLDVPVTVRGGPAALSMLEDGMQVYVVYRTEGEARIALSVDQLPDNEELLLY